MGVTQKSRACVGTRMYTTCAFFIRRTSLKTGLAALADLAIAWALNVALSRVDLRIKCEINLSGRAGSCSETAHAKYHLHSDERHLPVELLRFAYVR